jgi:hypothetical protein
VNNEGYGISLSDADGVYGNLVIDHNLYFQNGWRSQLDGGLYNAGAMVIDLGTGSSHYYPTLGDIQSHTSWEAHGAQGDPIFRDYDPDEHDLQSGSWPDFRLTLASTNAIDKGTATLPASLNALLGTFGVQDAYWGTALDIGRHEAGFSVLPSPSVQAIEPGGVAQFILHLYPTDLPDSVHLSVQSPSSDLTVALNPETIRAGTTATLTVTHRDSAQGLASGTWYLIPITGRAGDFVQTTHARLLVGGNQVYMPVVLRDAHR